MIAEQASTENKAIIIRLNRTYIHQSYLHQKFQIHRSDVNIIHQINVNVNTSIRCNIKYYRGDKMKRIRELREDNDKTQKEIAKVIGTTQQHYSRIENEKSDIYGEKLAKLCKYYNISADYILELVDTPRPLYNMQKKF